MARARPIDERHKIFAREYVVDHNATRAYKAAYPGCKSDGAARVGGSKLLTNANTQALIAEYAKAASERNDITVDRVLKEAARLAFHDIGAFFDPSGHLLAVRDMSADARAALASIEVLDEFEGQGRDRKKVGITTKLKVFDKNPAIERLFRHLGLYKNDNAQTADAVAELLRLVNGRQGSRGIDLIKRA